MSPQKVRLVVDLIRKKTVDQSLAQLKFANKESGSANFEISAIGSG